MLSKNYPAQLGREMKTSYVDMREAGEEFYARAIRAGATDPDDPDLEIKVFGKKLAGGIGNAMARGALLRRLRLAREGFPECYWIPKPASANSSADPKDRL